MDGEEALHALRASNGWATDVADRQMQRLASLLREHEGLSVLPASTAGLAALLDPHHRDTPGPLVAILTARRV